MLENDFNLKNSSEYLHLSFDDTFNILKSSQSGLSEEEAERRINLFGKNDILEKKENLLKLFLGYFWGPMAWLMEAAIILTIFINHYFEAVLISILLITNVIISLLHNRNSKNAVELLKSKLSIKVSTLRNGKYEKINSADLVPGDIVAVGLGNIIPADLKIINGELTIDQSSLTGESFEIDKNAGEIVFSGSSVKRGESTCVVLNIGLQTYFGKTIQLVKVAKPKSHQQKVVFLLVKYMFYFSLIIAFTVCVYAIYIQESLIGILTFIVILLMGAVPFALPTVLTILQSVGATELIKNNILVTRLNSIEDASSVDILFLDKTGTITENKLSVSQIIPFGKWTQKDVLLFSALTSVRASKDTIDEAIMSEIGKEKISFDGYKQVSTIPFDQETKKSESTISDGHEEFKIVKAAPQVALELATEITEDEKNNISKKIEELSQNGYRSLGILKSSGDNFVIVGLLALSDPPRKDAPEMFQKIKSLGITPIILTGDNIFITREIAKILGLNSEIILMSDLKKLSEKDQIKLLKNAGGVAEVLPEDKYDLVKLMQSNGHLVGMTGDGVNDAPALKQAEMGIAVANSTDVAKSSASMVLVEDGISVIVNAIYISRKIYQRILTWVLNKLSKTVRLLGTLAIAFFITRDIVISVLGTAFLVFANDFVSISLATDNVFPTSYPDKWDIIKISVISFLIGVPFILEHLFALFVGEKYFGIISLAQIQTFMLLTLIFTSQLKVNILRERRHFWNSFPGKALFYLTVLTMIIFAFMGIYGIFMAKISISAVLFSLIFAVIFTFFIDFFKYWLFVRYRI
jgi:H+-transporting ATPase